MCKPGLAPPKRSQSIEKPFSQNFKKIIHFAVFFQKHKSLLKQYCFTRIFCIFSKSCILSSVASWNKKCFDFSWNCEDASDRTYFSVDFFVKRDNVSEKTAFHGRFIMILKTVGEPITQWICASIKRMEHPSALLSMGKTDQFIFQMIISAAVCTCDQWNSVDNSGFLNCAFATSAFIVLWRLTTNSLPPTGN